MACDAIAKKLYASKAVVDATLKGRIQNCRRPAALPDLSCRENCQALIENFGPIIDELKELGKTNTATVSIASVKYCAHKLQHIIGE